MTSSNRLRGWMIDPQDDSSLPASRGHSAEKGFPSGSQSNQSASTNSRTVKVPRNVWSIGQQVYESNLTEFGLSKEVAALAASYVRYNDHVLNLKGASMIAGAFSWNETEEGEAYWEEVFKQAMTLQEMWGMLTKEPNNE